MTTSSEDTSLKSHRKVEDPGALVTAALIGLVYLACLAATGYAIYEMFLKGYMH